MPIGTAFVRDNDVGSEGQVGSIQTAEQPFATIQTAPVMVWTSTPDKSCDFVNNEWLKFTGRALEEQIGDGWTACVHPQDLERCVRTYSSAFDARRELQMQIRVRRTDGEYRWMLCTGRPRFSTNGVFAGYIGSNTDITELKWAQEDIFARQKLETLGLLSSAIAHDFNNLIGCILADTDIMSLAVPMGSPLAENLRHIKSVAAQATEMVRQIMDYAGDQKPDPGRINIAQLIREVYQLLRVCLPKSGELILDLADDLLTIYGSPAQVRQLLMNLVINAAEALLGRPGTVTITAARKILDSATVIGPDFCLAPGEYVCIGVSDTGIGMSAETRARIFDPFFSTKKAGRGLGLAVAHGIVQRHGGSIGIESIPGEGTGFEVLFPAAHPMARRKRTARTVDDGLASDSGSVLVVEDEAGIRLATGTTLRKHGFAVFEAEDGEAALDLLRTDGGNIAVVLLDLTLPRKSGMAVFRELRRLHPQARVLITSAFRPDALRDILRGAHFTGFLPKPYPLETMVGAVRDAFAGVAGRSRGAATR